MSSTIALTSYAVSAGAYFLLLVLSLAKWRHAGSSVTLPVACLVSFIWAGATAYSISEAPVITVAVHFLEILRNAAWSAFLLSLLVPSRIVISLAGVHLDKKRLAYLGMHATVVAAFILSLTVRSDLLQWVSFLSGSFGLTVCAIAGLLLIEQLLRHVSSRDRWAVKFAFLGIGGMLAFDFYLYVDAMLFNRIDADAWTARGFICALAASLIATSVVRGIDRSVGISVSRRFLFHSVTLVGCALYLLSVAGAGYYLKYFGGEWGPPLQLAFLSAASILLFTILFSGSFRSWLKVTLSKHFYAYGYDYREEWLRFTRTLSVEGGELGERAIEAIASLVESTKGILVLQGPDGSSRLAAQWNTMIAEKLDISTEHGANGALYKFLNTRHWVIDLHELRSAPEKYGDLQIPEWMSRFPQAWLIVPLKLETALVGFIVLGEPRSRIRLNWEILDLLKVVGTQTASYIARQETENALALARQFETFNRMSTFVVHDLKNLVSQLALLVANAERHGSHPEFQKDMVETIDHAVSKMRGLLERFKQEASVESLEAINLAELLDRVVGAKRYGTPSPVLTVENANLKVSANVSRLERVIGHLIQNAMEATPPSGSVAVKLSKQDGHAIVEVCDTGRGMSQEFIKTRLYKPFESTKPAGMGIGLFETREYLQQIGGSLRVQSELLRGTQFAVSLPLLLSAASQFDQAA